MKNRIVIALLSLYLAGCATMTPEEKRLVWIGIGSTVIVGAIVASQARHAPAGPVCSTHFIVGPSGSTPVTRCN